MSTCKQDRPEGVNIMPRNSVCCCAIVIGSIIVWAGSVLALQTTLAVDQAVAIVNPCDEAEERALVQYEIPDHLSSADILYAELRGQVDATPGGRQVAVEVQAHALSTDWVANSVTWNYPWSTPGGDAGEGFLGSYLVGADRRQVRIDVTDLVREWVSERRSNYGLMLGNSDAFAGTLSLVTDGGRETFRVPSIRIWYLPRPAR
jgi:hypothetical protein